jgi:putative ABC transport system substrate-binding protein
MKKSLALALLTLLLIGAGAEQGKKVALVVSNASPSYQALVAGFKVAFSGDAREINLEGSDEKARLVGEELSSPKPDLVVAVGDLAAQMVKRHLPDVPMVYCDSASAATLELAPGKTFGVYHEPDPAEQLNTLIGLFPEKKRVGLIYGSEFARFDALALQRAAKERGVTLTTVPLGSIKEVPEKLRSLIPVVDLLWVFTDPSVLSTHSIQFIVIQSITAGIPVFCGDNALAHSGATAAFVPDMADAGIKAGREANAALSGKAPAGQTLVYPKGKLILNQRTATMLKITFSSELSGKADEIIQ